MEFETGNRGDGIGLGIAAAAARQFGFGVGTDELSRMGEVGVDPTRKERTTQRGPSQLPAGYWLACLYCSSIAERFSGFRPLEFTPRHSLLDFFNPSARNCVTSLNLAAFAGLRSASV